jgi:acetoin utilization protein AcuB
MGINIYDPKGFRLPYHPESNWRNISSPQEVLPYPEKNRDQKQEKEEQKLSGLAIDILEKSKKQKSKVQLAKKEDGLLYAYQIMKKPVVTLTADTSMHDAWKLIRDHRFRHVPVVNKEGRLIGILSDRTLLREASIFEKSLEYDFEKVAVKDIMTQPVLTAHPHTEISYIAKIFINERIGAMPVIDDDHKILGILTRTDILRTIVKIDLFEMRI